MTDLNVDTLNRAVIVGGGPAGTACALTLLRAARERGREMQVVVLEPKHFGEHYNQCAGVLTSGESLARLMADLGLELAQSLVQRIVRGYVLHAGSHQIDLLPQPGHASSCAVRRVQLDDYLLGEAMRAGVIVRYDRMTDLEFRRNGVVVYTEGGTCEAEVVIGAFGLDPGAGAIFARRTAYRPPPQMDTLVTKLHPGGLEPIEGLLEDCIHAFLPRIRRVEFGALIPKGNHISIIIAGRGITESDMKRFVALPEVAELLPRGIELTDCYRGAFPVGLAHRPWGDRYLTAGDAAGLVRPFKGGGIAAALTTGGYAGLSLVEHGVSAEAHRAYLARCEELRGDMWYGWLLRRLVALLSGPLHMEAIIEMARESPDMQRVLYDCVSGHSSYRHILRRELTAGCVARAAWACMAWPLRRPEADPAAAARQGPRADA